jgi:hypothetical protein
LSRGQANLQARWPAFIYLSVDILLRMNPLEKYRCNGKKQPKPVSRDRPKTLRSCRYKWSLLVF